MIPLTGEALKERDHRWQRTRDFMKGRGLDGLVVAGLLPIEGDPLDRYLSNWVPGCIVIFPLEKDPTLLVPMVTQILSLTPDTPQDEFPWIHDIRPGARGSVIAAVLKEKGLEMARIGVVGTGGFRVQWEGWIPYRTWNRVLEKLPECEFEDVTTEFGELTMVRNDRELEQVRKAAKALERAGHEMLKSVSIGATELDVTSAIQSSLSREGVYSPKLILRSGPNTASWEDPAWMFGVGSPRRLESGDMVLAEIFASYAGMEAQVQMAVAIPPLSPEDDKCAKLAHRAYEVGLEHLRPGKKFSEVVYAMDSVMNDPNVWYLTPLIHSLNPMACVGLTGVGIDKMPGQDFYNRIGTRFGSGHIRGGEIRLEPGMVFELEPNACIKRNRVNVGGTVIVTEDGPEPLNDISTRMHLIGDI